MMMTSWIPWLHFAVIAFLLGKERIFGSRREFALLYGAYLVSALLYSVLQNLGWWEVFFLAAFPVGLRVWYFIQKRKDIENGMVNFLSTLSARLSVDDDIVTAIENSIPYITSKYIKISLIDFSNTVRLSCGTDMAFEKMRLVDHAYFRYVFLNLQQLMDSWGNPRELVRELETEYISVQVEVNKGRAELQNDRMMSYFGLALAGITAIQLLSGNPLTTAFYSERPLILLLLFGLAMGGVAMIARTKVL